MSAFNPALMPMDCNRHGEERACINCGYCAQVCPVDILPQFTYKTILADALDKFNSSRVDPYESAGIVAAQSIG